MKILKKIRPEFILKRLLVVVGAIVFVGVLLSAVSNKKSAGSLDLDVVVRMK